MEHLKLQKILVAASATAALAGLLVYGPARAQQSNLEKGSIDIKARIFDSYTLSTCSLDFGDPVSNATLSKTFDFGDITLDSISGVVEGVAVSKLISFTLSIKNPEGTGNCDSTQTVNTAIGVTTNSNNFNISDSTCWCDNLNPTGSTKTCSLPNITGTQNTIAKKSLLFRRCTAATNVSYQLQINMTLPSSFPLSLQFCPLADVTSLTPTSATSQQQFPCIRVTSKVPTCSLNIPGQVTLPTVNALSDSSALKLQTATSIPIGLSNCTNTAEFNLTPRVTFTDANGPSLTCDLKNTSTDTNTSKSSIALAFDSGFNNPICVTAYPASTNNTLSFDPIVAGSQTATSQTKNIWAAVRAGAGDTGVVTSKVTVSLDYR